MDFRQSASGRSVLRFAAMLLLGVAAGQAFAQEWVAVQKRGTVLMLVDDQWREVARGGMIADGAAVRTLQGGRVELQRPGATVTLGADTVLQTLGASGDHEFGLRQYSGSIDLHFGADGGKPAVVETPSGAVTTDGGVIVITLEGDDGLVEIESGTATVTDAAQGHAWQLETGQSVTTGGSLTGPAEPTGETRGNQGTSVTPIVDPSAAPPKESGGRRDGGEGHDRRPGDGPHSDGRAEDRERGGDPGRGDTQQHHHRRGPGANDNEGGQ